jgi:FAD/FMN-containing dehydrogenase
MAAGLFRRPFASNGSSRRHGLTIDNLLKVDVVLADGRFVTADAGDDADL